MCVLGIVSLDLPPLKFHSPALTFPKHNNLNPFKTYLIVSLVDSCNYHCNCHCICNHKRQRPQYSPSYILDFNRTSSESLFGSTQIRSGADTTTNFTRLNLYLLTYFIRVHFASAAIHSPFPQPLFAIRFPILIAKIQLRLILL